MKTTRILPLAASCALLCAAASRADPAAYRPLRTDARIEIDGLLDESCWRQAPVSAAFRQADGKPAAAGASVRICHDRQRLYFGIVCEEPNVDRLRREVATDNGPVWSDDSIELFIAPDIRFRNAYRHLAFNTLGTRFTAVKGDSAVGAAAWRVAVRVGKARWVAELAVPFAVLGIADGPCAHLIGASVCRERWAGVKEFTSWEVGGAFHLPAGHVLFTSYAKFVRDVLRPAWEKRRDALAAKIHSNPTVKARLLPEFNACTSPLDAALAQALRAPLEAAADCDRLLCRLNTAAAALRSLQHRANMLLLAAIVNE